MRAPLLLGEGAGEPNIAVAPDGTIYVTPVDVLFRSTDGGWSFEDLGASKTVGHGDGDIAVDGSGRLHWLGLGGSPPGPVPYQFSDDRGDTFSDPFDVSSGEGADRQWLGARSDGTLYANWLPGLNSEAAMAVNVSLDGGQTWGPTHPMGPSGIRGPIVPGPVRGQVYQALTVSPETPGVDEAAVVLLRSLDHGATWDRRTVAVPAQSAAQYSLVGLPTSIFPVVAVDDAGGLYVVFSSDQRAVIPTEAGAPKPAARFGVFLSTSGDGGETWSAPRLISDPGRAAVFPWAAAGAAGRVAVTWYENELGLPAESGYDSWNVKLYESIDALGSAPQEAVVQLNEDPAYVGPICTTGAACLVARNMLDFFEVALTPEGQPVVAWSSSTHLIVGPDPLKEAAGPTLNWFGTVDGTPLR